MAKPRFSFADHKAAGVTLKDIRDRLQDLAVQIGNAYPLTLKLDKHAAKAVAEIDALRNALDSQMFKDCPEETRGDDWKGVYYGPREIRLGASSDAPRR